MRQHFADADNGAGATHDDGFDYDDGDDASRAAGATALKIVMLHGCRR